MQCTYEDGHSFLLRKSEIEKFLLQHIFSEDQNVSFFTCGASTDLVNAAAHTLILTVKV